MEYKVNYLLLELILLLLTTMGTSASTNILRDTIEEAVTLNSEKKLIPYLNRGESNKKKKYILNYLLNEKFVNSGMAQNTIGSCYMNGHGTSINYHKAFVFFQRAVNLNYPTSYYYVGWCYEYGYGPDISYALAYKHYLKAMEYNVKEAIFKIGTFHQFGKGGAELNYAVAFEYLMKYLVMTNDSTAIKNINAILLSRADILIDLYSLRQTNTNLKNEIIQLKSKIDRMEYQNRQNTQNYQSTQDYNGPYIDRTKTHDEIPPPPYQNI